MKKSVLIIALLSVVPVLGVVREDDPGYTPEQRQKARETNERINQRNKERMAEGEKQLEVHFKKYKDIAENAKKRLKGNVAFQKEFAVAAGQFGTALTRLAERAAEVFSYNPTQTIDWTKDVASFDFDYFAPVLAKYDTEVKKYLDARNAIIEKYRPVEG